MLLNCGVGEDSWEFLGLQEDRTRSSTGNQSWIFIGRTDAEREAPNTLATWLRRASAIFLMLGKIEGGRSRWQRTRWLDGITNSMDTNLSKLQKIVKDREARHAVVHGVTKSRTWLSDWTTTALSVLILNSHQTGWCIIVLVINDKHNIFWHFKLFWTISITLTFQVIVLFPYLNFKYFEIKNDVYFLSVSLIVINKFTNW